MYPSAVFSQICNEHSRYYSTILTGNYTVLKNLTFLYNKLRLLSVMHILPQVGESDNFCLWNPKSGEILLLESRILGLSRIRDTAQGIPNVIQNPSSTDKDWNPASGIRNRRGIQNPRMSWIPLYAVCGGKKDKFLL